MHKYTDRILNPLYNDFNPNPNPVNRTDIDFIEDHKARFLTEIDKAEDWLELVKEIESLRFQIREKQWLIDSAHNEINNLHRKNNQKDKIIETYTKRFWDYEVNHSNQFLDEEIRIPTTDEEKLYNKIFFGIEYPYSRIESGKKIVCTFHMTDTENIMVSKKVTDINPIKIETVIPNKIKKWIKKK